MQLKERLQYRGRTAGLYTLIGMQAGWRQDGKSSWGVPLPAFRAMMLRMRWLLEYTDSLQSSLHVHPASKYRGAVAELLR